MKRKRTKADNLTKRREKWYVRVYYRQNEKNKEKLIPLRTSSKVTARARALEVRKVEQDIKQGIEFDFPWLTKEVRTKVKRFTIQDAVNQWMAKREGKLAKKTIDINKEGLNYFLKYIGDAHPLETVVTEQVESFIDWLDNRGLSKTTINIHLRTLKTMFRYYDKVDKLNKVPHIVQLSVPKTEPIYITDNEFQAIMELGWLGDFYKRVFLFYRETGMRLNEPMMSVLKGNWMDIPNTSKSKVGRNIELDKPMQSIFNELKEWLNTGYGSTLKAPDDHISKMFKKSLRCIGADERKHFHSLRHTFAVRRLLQDTSIFYLQKLMGHSTVTTTEVYSKMNLKRVAQDFPTIVSSFINEEKNGKTNTLITNTTTLPMTYMS